MCQNAHFLEKWGSSLSFDKPKMKYRLGLALGLAQSISIAVCAPNHQETEYVWAFLLLSFTLDQQFYPELKKGFLNKCSLNCTFLWKGLLSANNFVTEKSIRISVCQRGFLTALLGQSNLMPLFRLPENAIRSFHLIYQLTLQWVPSCSYKFPFEIPKSRIWNEHHSFEELPAFMILI